MFSVIVPAFNCAAYVERALASVYEQTLADHELIVVDDGSTDDTWQLLQGHSARAILLQQANQGPGKARNLGAQSASGSYLVFLDSDDTLPPWALAVLRQVALECDGPALILGRPQSFRSDLELERLRFDDLVVDRWDDYLDSADSRPSVFIAGAVRADAFDASGGFSESNVAALDHDCWLRLGTAAGFAYVHAPAIYGYRDVASSNSKQTGALYRGLRLILERERLGEYPGGQRRAAQRHLVIARILRAAIRRCLANGGYRHAYTLYLLGLGYLLRTGHWTDIWRFPLYPISPARRAAKSMFRSLLGNRLQDR